MVGRPPTGLRTYVRADEKQFVFIIAADEQFRVVETAELWEPSALESRNCCFCFYPTVIDLTVFDSLADAEAAVLARYRWTTAVAEQS